MAYIKVNVLGFLVILSFILNTIGVFSSGWIGYLNQDGGYDYSAGIVPFHPEYPTWFNVASWLMFATFSFVLLNLYIFKYGFLKLAKNGFSSQVRKPFVFIGLVSAVIVIFTITAVTLIGVNLPNLQLLNNDITLVLYYSAWISVSSAVLTAGSCVLAMYIAIKGCR